MNEPAAGIALRPLVKAEDLPAAGQFFLFDDEDLPVDLANASVILRNSGHDRAIELIARNADRVLIGEAALLDSALIKTLNVELGTEKVGVWVPVRRRSVTWALDMVSNSTFRCLTPSYGKASWEILMSNGTETGTDVEWWIAQMFELGASQALVGVDMNDDSDLNICAGLAERFGASFWLTPLLRPDADMAPWIQFGQARNLAVPGIQYADENRMLGLRQAIASLNEQPVEIEVNSALGELA